MEKKIRVLIVEDEYINLELLQTYLEEMGYEISGDAMNPKEAIDVLERLDTDLAILDINLKSEQDGIWIAKEIRANYHIPFIFLTAYSDKQTIQRAAEVNPYGYLVKPFTKADILASIEIALKNYEKEQKTELAIEVIESNKELEIEDAIFIRDNTNYRKILISEISYIQAFKNYTELTMPSGRLVLRSSLQNILAMLPSKFFAQVHRSFIVNINHIDSVQNDFIVMGNNKIPLSRTHKSSFLQKIHFLG